MSWQLTLMFMLGTFLPLGLVWGVMTLRRDRRHDSGSRHPFGSGLLRNAGHSIRLELEDVRLDLVETVLSAGFAGITATILYLALQDGGSLALGLTLLLWGIAMALITRKTLGLLPLVRHLRLGWEAEVATAEELNRLMLDGCHVFHDVPADGHNIDHVVVAPGGVYAVETHVRFRARADAGKEMIAVARGDRLYFIGREDDLPLQRAQQCAQWLAQWLSRVAGQPVVVTPALSLPGWFVKTEMPGPVLVFPPKLARSSILKNRRVEAIGAEQLKQLVTQIEQHCRAAKPEFLLRAG